MLPKLQAHYIQAFTNYKSSDGSLGVTALQAGIQFKNGLYVGGTFSAAGLPLTTDNITISGTAGNGYIQYAAQTVAPSLALVHVYADSGGHFAIGASGSTANDISFTNSLMTANRSYAFQDKTGTLAMVGDNVSEFTNDSGFVVGPGSAVSGRLPSFNGTTGKLIQDSGILASDVVSGPSSAVTGRIASFNGTTGKLIQDSGILASSVVLTSRTLTEGAGLAGNTYDLSANRTLAMGTPSTLSIASTNTASGTTHAHLITSSSNPGAAAALLSSNASGYLQLVRVGIGVAPTQPLHVAGNAFIDAATANLYLKDTSTGFQATTTLIITPQSGNAFRNTAYTSGLVGWNISDAGNAEFNNVDVRGAIHAGILAYNQIQTTAGTLLVTKAAAKLKTDVTIPGSPTYGTTTVNIDVVDPDGITHGSAQLFVVNDVIRLKDGLVGDTWFTVSSASDQTTFWRYVCKIQAGTNNVTYRAGIGVIDYGLSGAGFIMLTADQTNSPYEQMATHAATFTSANSSGTLVVTPQLRLGNLNGSYGYSSNTFGLGVGDYGAANSWLTVDPTNGLQVFGGAGTVHLDANGFSFTPANDSSGTNASTIRWMFSGHQLSWITSGYASSDGTVNLNLDAHMDDSPTSGTGKIVMTVVNNDASANAGFNLQTKGSTASANPSKSYANLYPITGTFLGLTIGSTSVPTHMLDVYGEGYFQSNVAIGTTSTGSVGGDGGTFTNLRVHNSTGYGLLTLSGPGTADGGNGGIISMGSTGAGSTDKRFVVINGTSDGSSASTTNGRLDIYTTNAGTSNLALRLSKAGLLRLPGYGAGTLSTDASGNITASSDEKLKTNIRTFRKGLIALKKLEPILYRWNKKSGLDSKHDYVGFGARHSKRHIPEAVGKGRDGFHTMSDRAILATVVNAVKELEQMYATR